MFPLCLQLQAAYAARTLQKSRLSAGAEYDFSAGPKRPAELNTDDIDISCKHGYFVSSFLKWL